MEKNILKTSDVSKIYLKFTDGKNHQRKELVTVRYMDDKHYYFNGRVPTNFAKPKWRAKTDIIVYTPEGVYNANVIIREVNFTLSEILYKVDLPRSWKFTQLRAGSRKKVQLPLTLKFNDGLEIQAETVDLSVGGFSFISKQDLSVIHTRFASNCKIQFPKEGTINFPDGLLEIDTMYVRQKAITDDYELEGHKIYSFKFLNLSPDYKMILKNFLMKII